MNFNALRATIIVATLITFYSCGKDSGISLLERSQISNSFKQTYPNFHVVENGDTINFYDDATLHNSIVSHFGQTLYDTTDASLNDYINDLDSIGGLVIPGYSTNDRPYVNADDLKEKLLYLYIDTSATSWKASLITLRNNLSEFLDQLFTQQLISDEERTMLNNFNSEIFNVYTYLSVDYNSYIEQWETIHKTTNMPGYVSGTMLGLAKQSYDYHMINNNTKPNNILFSLIAGDVIGGWVGSMVYTFEVGPNGNAKDLGKSVITHAASGSTLGLSDVAIAIAGYFDICICW